MLYYGTLLRQPGNGIKEEIYLIPVPAGFMALFHDKPHSRFLPIHSPSGKIAVLWDIHHARAYIDSIAGGASNPIPNKYIDWDPLYDQAFEAVN